MISYRVRGVEVLFTALQAASVVVLFWAWFTLLAHLSAAHRPGDLSDYNAYCLALLVGLLSGTLAGGPESLGSGLYERSILDHLPIVFRQTVWSVGSLLVFLVISKDNGHISRLFLITFVPAMYGMLLWTHRVLPGMLAWALFREMRQENTLLVGSCHRVARLTPWLRRKARYGVRTVGVLCDEEHVHYSPPQCPVVGLSLDLERVVKSLRVSQVIVIEFRDDSAALVEPVQRSGARLLILSDLAERLGHSISMFEDDGFHFFSLHPEPLENPFNRILKRGFDILFSLLVLLIILPPLAAAVWLIHRVQSPGPLFFRQVRAGIQNREFTIWKFRTMHPGEPPDETDANRTFPAGQILRRYSLDEFPQFINVLRGEMSIVGPRPHLVEHNVQFAQVMSAFHIRAFVRPGITGLAQVRGFRGEAGTVDAVSHRLESDMVYIENWSPLLDVVVMLRTAWQIFFPPDAAR